MEELARRFPEHQKLVDAEVICKFMIWASQNRICLGRGLRGEYPPTSWPCDLTIKPAEVMARYLNFNAAAFEREVAEMEAILAVQHQTTFGGRN